MFVVEDITDLLKLEEEIGGSIHISTRLGELTSFEIQVPHKNF